MSKQRIGQENTKNQTNTRVSVYKILIDYLLANKSRPLTGAYSC